MPCSTANKPPPILSVAHIYTVLYCIPIVSVEKERRIKNWSMRKPEKAAHVITGTAFGTTGPVPADSRQWAPSVAVARLYKFGAYPMAVGGINGRLRGNREGSLE